MAFCNKNVSCIIPAYNEEKTIAPIINVCANHPLIDEVFVIDDGSEDGTYASISSFDSEKVKILHNQRNMGKAESVLRGFQKSSGDLIMMIDSDLEGLNSKNIDDLLKPHCHIKCMTMVRWNTIHPTQALTGVPLWSGMRVFSREIMEEILKKAEGYSIEAHINDYVVKNQIPTAVIYWQNVHHKHKIFKLGLAKGIEISRQMHREINKDFSAFKNAYHLIALAISNLKTQRELRVRYKYIVPHP